MASFVVTHELANYVGQGDVELDAHTFKAALTNVAPTAAGSQTLSGITQIGATGGYAVASLTGVTFAETGAGTGIWQWSCDPFAWTASGADFDEARYVAIYDDSHASDVLIGFVDYEAAFVVTDGNSFTVTPGANGVFRITVN